MRRALLLALALPALVRGAGGDDDEDDDPMKGWRMVDRFDGFRYEVRGDSVANAAFIQGLVDQADDLACFGWVQSTAVGTVVGEGRCNKRAGPILREWLERGAHPAGVSVSGVDFKLYEDTKIKLHFSHFKVLEPSRLTCFQAPPHQCPPEHMIPPSGGGGGGASGGGGEAHDEL